MAARRRAHARERRAVEEQHVVGVEAGEAARERLAGQAGVGEEAHAVESGVELAPALVGGAARVVDVEVVDATGGETLQLRRERQGVPPAEGLDMHGDPEAGGASGACDERQARVLGRSGAPPGDDHRVDAGRSDLAHLRAEDGRVGRRVGAAGGIPAGGNRGRRLKATLVPVLPGAVPGRRAVPRVEEDGDGAGSRRPGGLRRVRSGTGGQDERRRCRAHRRSRASQGGRTLHRFGVGRKSFGEDSPSRPDSSSAGACRSARR